MATVIRLFGTIVNWRLLWDLFRQSILSFCQQIGKHLYHCNQIWSMDQICSGNRRITVEYAKFHGKLNTKHGLLLGRRKKMFRFLPTFWCGSCVTTLPFQTTIGTVERNINGMLQYQSHSRSSEARDFALLIDNNSYVQNWSLIQISVILLTCSIQVGKSMCSIHTFLLGITQFCNYSNKKPDSSNYAT